MKKNILKFLVAVLALFMGFAPLTVFAEEETVLASPATSISISPTDEFLQISSGSTYDKFFTIENDGEDAINFEVYSAPYSYVYSEEQDSYQLGFANENNYTQMTRWISFRNQDGEYVARPVFSVEGKSSLDVHYRITTPDNIPGGGQYAVIFAHTLASANAGGGIRTEVSPGLVIYGRSTEGEPIISAEISDLDIVQEVVDKKDSIVATAKVKNTGNVDFNVISNLKVTPIIGFSSYETPATGGRLSVIPESELTASDAWVGTPMFGIYKATFTVTVGDKTETIEKIIFRISPIIIIIAIILLTIIIISIIMGVRRSRMRRSRLSV